MMTNLRVRQRRKSALIKTLAASMLVLATSSLSAIAGGARLSLIYSFQGFKIDGQWPKGGLLDVKGTLYGTTTYGGAYDKGSVFAVNPETGQETTLYSLPDDYSLGMEPNSGLILLNGKLYGTAVDEGAGYYGTVFSYDLSTGTGAPVYSFQGGNDGGTPVAGLLAVKGKLIGTTYVGGTYNNGTLFSVDPATGAETVLHSFQVNGTDAAYPLGGVLDYKGIMYGMTEAGGTSGQCGVSGCGAIYALDPKSGAYSVLYSFQNPGTNGVEPYSTLIAADGVLYGTTMTGGGTGCSSGFGCGTVFSFDLATGKETVLHKFDQEPTNGVFPASGLIELNGVLYGTASEGGEYSCNEEPYRCGIVYSISPTTGFHVLHDFHGGHQDGGVPYGGVIAVKGKLYGATEIGGTYTYGTVFELTR